MTRGNNVMKKSHQTLYLYEKRNGNCNDSHSKLNVVKHRFLLFVVLWEFCTLYFGHIHSLPPGSSQIHSLLYTHPNCVIPTIALPPPSTVYAVYRLYLLRCTAFTCGWSANQGPWRVDSSSSYEVVITPELGCNVPPTFPFYTSLLPGLSFQRSRVSCLNCYESTCTTALLCPENTLLL